MIQAWFYRIFVNLFVMAVSTLFPSYSTEEIIQLIQANDRNAFDYLYKNYSESLYRTITLIVKDSQTAEDVLQESFVKIWLNFDKFDGQKSGLYNWMKTIAYNSAVDFMRCKIAIIRSRSNELLEDSLLGRLNVNDSSLDFTAMLTSLKPEQQKLVQLAYYQGYTFEQMAALLQKPLGTIKTRMRAVLKRLRCNHPEYNMA